MPLKIFSIFLLFLLAGRIVHAQTPAYDAQNVRLLCNWSDNANIPSATGAYYNDVWGFVQGGREYAAIGSATGVHIVAVNNCQQVAFAAGKNANPFVYHRDVKTYKHYLYAVAQESEASLQVFDLQYLPDSLHLVWESSSAELATAHSLFVDTTAGRLYASTVSGTATGTDALRIYSLANPEAPVRTHRIGAPQGVLSPVHTVFAHRDTAFLSVSNYGYLVATFGQNDTFKIIGGTTSYPSQGFTHSSWVNEQGYGVLADETGGLPLKIIDVRSLPQVLVKSTFSPCTGDTCVPHNPFLVGNTAFISHYYQGLQIYNIANPANAVRIGYFDTAPGLAQQSYGGAWGCYPYLPSGKVVVSDMQRGLFVLDVSEAIAYANNPSALVSPVPPVEMALHIFPNPATRFMEVAGLSAAGPCEVEIWEGTTGRRLLWEARNAGANGTLGIALPADWNSGLYCLRVFAGGKSSSSLFLKSD